VHCVFGFLEWSELLRCARTCRLWLGDVASLPPSCALSVSSGEQAEQLLRSALRAPVGELNYGTLTLLNLAALASQLPRLRRLKLLLPLSELLRVPLGFPSRLQVLELHSIGIGVAMEGRSAIFSRFVERVAGVVPPTLHSLALNADDHSLPLSLAALAALARIDSLTALHVTVDWDDPAVRTFCRGLPLLRSLRRTRYWWTAASLAQLTEGELGVDYPPLESLGKVAAVDEAIFATAAAAAQLDRTAAERDQTARRATAAGRTAAAALFTREAWRA